MANDKYLIAVLCADLHLSGKPPIARSVEEDWLETQASYLRQLRKLCMPRRELGASALLDNVPCLLAGDIFDKPQVPHEVVNLALKELPTKVYSIAGNHDLPGRRLDTMHRSAYGTLVEAARVIDLKPGKPLVLEGPLPLRLWGFPDKCEVTPLTEPHALYFDIALVHAYIWTQQTGYPGAKDEQRLSAYKKKLHGYDLAVFGDNHKGFLKQVTTSKPGELEKVCTVLNCGGFMRRKSDEKEYQPSVGLLYSDGSVERRPLDCSQDKFVDVKEVENYLDKIGVDTFIDSLLELGDAAVSFDEMVQRVLDRKKVDERVKEFIIKALNKGQPK